MVYNKNIPPKLAKRLLHWFIRDDLAEEVLGDLEERFYQDKTEKSSFRARLNYWCQVLNYLRPFAIRKSTSFAAMNYGMYRSHLKIGYRNLLRHKWYSLITIGGLAVGMGICLTIFQYIHFELSYDNFHKNSRDTYRITIDKTQNGGNLINPFTTYGMGPGGKETIPEIRRYVRFLQAGIKVVTPNLDISEPFNEEFLIMHLVDTTFLDVFNFPLKLGNKESVFDEKFNIVITEKIAHKYFGTNNPIGKTLKLLGGGAVEEGNYKVSGLLENPPLNSHLQFDFLLSLENSYTDVTDSYKNREAWEQDLFVTYISIDGSADSKPIGKKLDQLIAEYRGSENISEKVVLQPITDIHLKSSALSGDIVTNKGSIRDVRIYFIVAISILIMAWVNYINLSTVRSIRRAKEVGVRKTIGAFRKQLIGQFMIESVLDHLIAATLSVVIASLALPVLSHILGKELTLSFLQIPIFWMWFFIIIVLGLLLSGLYPAFILSSFKPISMLGANSTGQVGNASLRRGLIVFQFLISLLLIAGTYLVYKQVTFMKNQELGIDMEKILVVKGPRINLGTDVKSIVPAFRTALARHSSISDIASSHSVPGKGYNGADFRKLGDPVSKNQHGRMVPASLNFPETYDLKFLAGSSFTEDISNRESYIIINEEAVRVFGLGTPEKAVGETLIRIKGIDVLRPYKVIGVVKNFNWNSLREKHMPYLFIFSPDEDNYFSFKVNLAHIQESLANIEKTYMSFFPGKAFDYFFLEDEFNDQYRAEVRFGKLFSAFGLLAIFIACIGLFSLVSFSVTFRKKEIGVRKVFGASIGSIMVLLFREFLLLLIIAIFLALPTILIGANSWLEQYAFRIGVGFDLFLFPAFVLALISLLTIGHQTYCSAKANPVDALKSE